MLVPRICRLECVAAGANLQNDVDDVLELHVMDARAHIDAVASVKSNFVRRNAGNCGIERFDPQFGPFAAVRDAEVRPGDVIGDQKRIVDLKQEAGIDDGLIFLPHRVRDRKNIGLRRRIIFVGSCRLDIRWCDRGNKSFRRGDPFNADLRVSRSDFNWA